MSYGSQPSRSPLGDRINRITYVVINVSDLDRSRAFYEAATSLRVVRSINAPRQPFHGLGIEDGTFRGVVLSDGSGPAPTEVHLLQWELPSPVGEPYPVFWNIGLAKIALSTVSVTDKVTQLKKAEAVFAPDVVYRRYVTVLDPDGVIVSFPAVQVEPAEPGADRRTDVLVHVNPSVRDVRRSMHFYGEVLGLDLAIESSPSQPYEGSQGPGSLLAQWDSHLFQARGGGPFYIDLSQFHHPAPSAEFDRPYPEANHIGITRIGLEVDDVDRCRRILADTPSVGEAPGHLGTVEDWNYGDDRPPRRTLCFRDPDGIRLEMVERCDVPVRMPAEFENPPPLPISEIGG